MYPALLHFVSATVATENAIVSPESEAGNGIHLHEGRKQVSTGFTSHVSKRNIPSKKLEMV
jgi:hypothetical protein